ncbi:hypothetical protein Taro_040424 [Colocasia esculenta]|uniref:Uncharacterized protein n=1 Tax=Colocasia esculenta TaxID=4460 RepID=A0A843W8Y9_COLES|nr:hypothetical protein [Colocasia esculenta]
MKVCRHTSHGVDTRPQVPRQKIDKFAKIVCRHELANPKNQATQVDTIADQVDTPDISLKATSQVLSGCRHQQGCVSTQDTFPEAQAVNFQTSVSTPVGLCVDTKGLPETMLQPSLSVSTQPPGQTRLKHSKEADPVEDFFGEEFEEDPTSQIAEHRLGLQASQVVVSRRAQFELSSSRSHSQVASSTRVAFRLRCTGPTQRPYSGRDGSGRCIKVVTDEPMHLGCSRDADVTMWFSSRKVMVTRSGRVLTGPT